MALLVNDVVVLLDELGVEKVGVTEAPPVSSVVGLNVGVNNDTVGVDWIGDGVGSGVVGLGLGASVLPPPPPPEPPPEPPPPPGVQVLLVALQEVPSGQPLAHVSLSCWL